MQTICPDYSTTRLVTREPPIIEKHTEDTFETLLAHPKGQGRQGEGGLRTQGYFKRSLPDKPLITVITVVYNGVAHLEETILSVIGQTYDNVEYIIIDGGSTDGTLEIIRRYKHAIDYWVSEKDRGIYDAMNKGIGLVYNADSLINFMNSDDQFHDTDVCSLIALDYNNEDFIYGKIRLDDEEFSISSGQEVTRNTLAFFTICHHQSIFTKRSVFFDIGIFSLNYTISSDYDFVVRCFLNSTAKKKYTNNVIAIMKIGGVSNTKVLQAFSEKFIIISKHYSNIIILFSFFYIFFYEIPRNKIRLFLQKKNLIKHWRLLRGRFTK